MGTVVNKPDAYLLDVSAKGFSLTDFSTWGLSNLSNPEGKQVGTVQAYTDVGWTRRCVNVRAKALSSMPFGLYRGDTLIWSDQIEKPDALAWLSLRDYLFRSEVALALMGATYALKEGTVRQDGTLRRIQNLRWFNPQTIGPDYDGPRDDNGEFMQFKRRIGSKTEYWDRRLVLHAFQPDPFTEQGPPSHTDGSAARIHAQVLSDMAAYTSEQLRSGLVKKTVAVAREGKPPPPEEKKRLEDWLGRYLFGRGNAGPKVISGNIDFQVVGASLDELAENAISREQQESMATAFGVPHSLVLSNAANYATSQADQLNFYGTTVIYQGRVLQDALNAQLFDQLDLEFRFEPDRLEVMQAAEQEKAASIAPLVAAGVYSVEYAQELLGVPDDFRTTTEAPAPTTVDEMDEQVQEDIKAWRRKIARRGPDVKFSPDHMLPEDAEVIRERLAAGMDLDTAFAPPFI